jgi:serine protease Do
MHKRFLVSVVTVLMLSLLLLVASGTQTSQAQVSGTSTPPAGTAPAGALTSTVVPRGTAVATATAVATTAPAAAATATVTSTAPAAAATATVTSTAPAAAATATVTSTAPSAAATATLTSTAPLSAPPEALAAFERALESIYTQVSPSVVNVQVVQSVAVPTLRFRGMPNSPMTPGPMTPGPMTPPNGGTQPFARGLGSGFIWDNQGHIITNNHVIDGASAISVVFSDGTTVTATVVGQDVNSDLAVLKVSAPAALLQPVTLGDSTRLQVGQLVVAIGNPFGFQGSMSTGIVSAVARSLPVGNQLSIGPTYSIPDIIQTDAAINPGNSGGVLTDDMGRVIGVTAAIESSANSSSGVGFAIPSAIVQKVVPALISNGKFSWPYLGISGTSLAPDVAQAMNLPAGQRGALVVQVLPGGPAAQAGLQGSEQSLTLLGQQVPVGGDVITAINGSSVKTFDDLVAYLARSAQVGQTVPLTILRNGRQQTLQVTLAARPAQSAATGQSATPPTLSGTPSATAPITGTQTMTGTQTAPTAPAATQTMTGTQTAPTGTAPAATPSAPSGVTPSAQATPGGGPRLGVFVMNVTSDLATAMNLPANQAGVLVVSVQQGSPADQAGLRGSFRSATIAGQQVMIGGDVITATNGQPVTTIQDLQMGLQQAGFGSTVKLTILRSGQQQQLSVQLAANSGGMTTPTP